MNDFSYTETRMDVLCFSHTETHMDLCLIYSESNLNLYYFAEKQLACSSSILGNIWYQHIFEISFAGEILQMFIYCITNHILYHCICLISNVLDRLLCTYSRHLLIPQYFFLPPILIQPRSSMPSVASDSVLSCFCYR